MVDKKQPNAIIRPDEVLDGVKSVAKISAQKTGKLLKGFRDFAVRGNAFELAVGVVIGSAFTALVNSLVNSVINPFIAGVFGSTDLSGIWIVQIGDSQIKFGVFFSSIISFVTIAGALYFFIILPLNKLVEVTRRKEDENSADENLSDDDQEPVTQEELLRDILTVLKNQSTGKAIKH